MSYIPARPRKTRPDFSLTVINIVFLLLLFYLATGSLIKQNELEADIPFTRDLPLEKLPRPLLLATADGQIYLDGAPLSLEEVPGAVKAIPEGMFVNVLAERTMMADALMAVLARAQASGRPVRLVTLRDRPETASRP
ncbi:ExbD/TolR family protein [Arvimicrobium flavum]|uniref:ExbD/TolR family protein n=1 Tax=Arvimicrobium flavum TaxID=3393320 RepID=UPI00237B5AB3|nr:biopolymer transporter ExbD [Mesorhizobium shangrilense]